MLAVAISPRMSGSKPPARRSGCTVGSCIAIEPGIAPLAHGAHCVHGRDHRWHSRAPSRSCCSGYPTASASPMRRSALWLAN
jgi:hypothetical protein